LTGRTRSHRLIHFSGSPALIGTITHVRVTGATALCLQGELEINFCG
jgi:tRNA-2-methylthio-N6-dimethylallyladenosine synthase